MGIGECRLVLAAISVMSFASLMSIPEAWRREPVLELFVIAIVALVSLETFGKGKKKPIVPLFVFILLYSASSPSYGACNTDRDFLCSGSACPGPAPGCCTDIDPDCCDGSHPCTTSGFYCELGSSTCLRRTGTCTSADQSNCQGGTYCSTDASLCISSQFVFLKPPALSTPLGTTPALTLSVFDPANRTGTYIASVLGTGKYFARFFGTDTTFAFTLRPNEAKSLPIYFSAGAIGSYQVQVQVTDSAYNNTAIDITTGHPRGITGLSTTSSVNVESKTKAPTFVSASGPPAGLLVWVLGGLAFVFLLL